MEWTIFGGVVLLATAWGCHRWAWWRTTVDESWPRILMYHMVREAIPGSRYNKLRVPPEEFEKQVRWLKEEGWEFVTVSDLLDRREGKKRVAVTFDDGYRDNLLHALPVLRKYGAKMTLYLVADRSLVPDWPAQRKQSRAATDLSSEKRLTDEEVKELVASGLVEVGSHTVTHVDLTQVDGEEKDWELTASRALLQEISGQPVRTFCYPFGLFSEEDSERLREVGYEAALTVEQGISDPTSEDPMRWKRVKVSGTEGMFSFRLRMRTGLRGWRR